jgi:hypothetical protein
MRCPWSTSLQQILSAAPLLLVLTDVHADQSARDNGPPPSEEAFKACEGHNERDLLQLPGETGDVFHAVCLYYRGKLAAQPAHRHGTKPTKPKPPAKPPS